MILATDEDTKKLHDLTGKDKKYTAAIDLSKMSDTRDMDYREQFIQHDFDKQWLTINWLHKPRPSLETLSTTLQLIAPHSSLKVSLPLPPFSAKKVWWKKRYDMARSGNQEIVIQEMKIIDIQIISYQIPELIISCHVWSGTYIRSIAYRLGQQLRTGGILTNLKRTKIGDYSLEHITNPDPSSKIPFQTINDNNE